MGRVEGKVALISGGARGMGASHAKRLAGEGASVVIGDVLDDEGQKTAKELGDKVKYIHLDVTKAADWKAAVDFAVTEFGALDVLVNNAGILHVAPIDEITEEQFDRVLEINLKGQFLGIQAAIPALKASTKGPSIINVSSVAGLKGFEMMPAYTTSKWGVRGLTKNAALDLGKYGIRANSVHPGTIRTPMTAAIPQGNDETPKVAMHRIGESDELSSVVLYLASDDSSFSSGAEFIADGGEMAGLIS